MASRTGGHGRRPVARRRAGGGRALLDAFVTADRIGDLAGLEHLFAEDVVRRADSGGVVRPAARVPVVGRRKAARLLQAYTEIFWAGVTARSLTVNRGIDGVLWQMNSAKLERVRRTWPTGE